MSFNNLELIVTTTSVVLATSTAVERVFSQGRQLLHFTRNRLNGSFVRTHLSLGSWFRNNLIGMSEIEPILRGSSQKWKQSEMSSSSSEVEVVE